MTTYVAAREDLITAFNAPWASAWPGVPMYFENTTQIDLDTAPPVFVAAAIDFTDGVRLDIDAAPMSKTWGEVTFRIFAKEGQGTKKALQVFDFLTTLMKYKQFGGVTTDFPVPGAKRWNQGWMSSDLNVPFFFYQ